MSKKVLIFALLIIITMPWGNPNDIGPYSSLQRIVPLANFFFQVNCNKVCTENGKIWKRTGFARDWSFWSLFGNNTNKTPYTSDDCLCQCPVPLEQDLIEDYIEKPEIDINLNLNLGINFVFEAGFDDHNNTILMCVRGGTRACSDFCRSGNAIDVNNSTVTYPEGGVCSRRIRCLCFCNPNMPNMIE